jgi:hypothetical protein
LISLLGLGRYPVKFMLLAAFIFSWSSWLSAQDKPWLEVRSPHFRVITNGSDRDARHVARAFEQMRAVFASQFPGFVLEAPAPLLVLPARNEETMKMLLPQMWKAQVGSNVAGLFQKGIACILALRLSRRIGWTFWTAGLPFR